MKLWLAENQRVGMDLRWTGSAGVRRAAATHHRLRSAGHPVSLIHDELGCTVCLGPVHQNTARELVDGFLGLG